MNSQIITTVTMLNILDECLWAQKNSVLQVNLFLVLTSLEMVALCWVMAILYFKICMPMQLLTRITHFLGLCGYNWSSHSMGKTIDALHCTCYDQDGWQTDFG